MLFLSEPLDAICIGLIAGRLWQRMYICMEFVIFSTKWQPGGVADDVLKEICDFVSKWLLGGCGRGFS